MANIQNYLNQIKTAVFGKDVRESIHNAIKQCYDDAAVNHDNANMEVKLARGSYNTLNDRLDENEKVQENFSSQLDSIVQYPNIEDINSIDSDKVKIVLNNLEYLNTSKINLKDNFKIEGRGIDKTLIKSSSKYNFFKDVWEKIYSDVELANFTLNMLNAPTDVVAGIHMKGFKNCIIRNVKVENNAQEGFYLEDCEDIMLINCISDSNKYGFSVVGNSKNIIFINCKAINNTWDGFLTNNLINSTFINCHAENNGYDGIDGTACGFYIAQDSYNIKLLGCNSKNNGGRGFELDRVWSCKISDCNCDGDKNGIKIIGVNSGVNKNIVNNCTVDVDNSPIIVMSSCNNVLTNLTLRTSNGTIGIIEDVVGGSNYNIYENIQLDGNINTVSNNINSKSKYKNIFLGKNPISINQSKTTTIYLDFVNGDDTKFGQNSLEAIKTIARLKELIEMNGQYVTVKVLGDKFCSNQNDLTLLVSMYGQGKIVFDFENRTITSIPTLAIGSNDIKSNIVLCFKNVTFSPANYTALYNYGNKMYFEKVIIPSNLTVECLSGGGIVCSNCNITPQMIRDNGSYIMRDRWDTTSTIHVGLTDLSPV